MSCTSIFHPHSLASQYPTSHIKESGHRKSYNTFREWRSSALNPGHQEQSPCAPLCALLALVVQAWTWLMGKAGSSNLSVSYSPAGLVGTQPWSFWFNWSGMGGARNCISNNFPCNADAAGLGTTLHKPLVNETSETESELQKAGLGPRSTTGSVWHRASHFNPLSFSFRAFSVGV